MSCSRLLGLEPCPALAARGALSKHRTGEDLSSLGHYLSHLPQHSQPQFLLMPRPGGTEPFASIELSVLGTAPRAARAGWMGWLGGAALSVPLGAGAWAPLPLQEEEQSSWGRAHAGLLVSAHPNLLVSRFPSCCPCCDAALRRVPESEHRRFNSSAGRESAGEGSALLPPLLIAHSAVSAVELPNLLSLLVWILIIRLCFSPHFPAHRGSRQLVQPRSRGSWLESGAELGALVSWHCLF